MKKKRFRLSVNTYLLYLVIASLLFTGVTLSKYVAFTNTSDNSSVAAFDVVVIADESASFDGNDRVGSCSFKVQNNGDVYAKYDIFLRDLPDDITPRLDDMDGQKQLDGSWLFTHEDWKLRQGGEFREHSLSFSAESSVSFAEDPDHNLVIEAYAEQID